MNNQWLAVLDATVNATIVNEIMGERIKYFVDVNVSIIGEPFRKENADYFLVFSRSGNSPTWSVFH